MMKKQHRQLIISTRLKMLLTVAFLVFSSGMVQAQNYLIDHTTATIKSIELRPATGNNFKVYEGGTLVGTYTSLGPIKVTGGGTLNIEFNTSMPVYLYKAGSTSGDPAYNTYSIIVTNGTLNMSLGSGYSASTTLTRNSDMTLDIFKVYSSTTSNQNSCKLNISGNASKRFVIDGGANMSVSGTDATTYTATNSGIPSTGTAGSLIYLYANGGCVTLNYVNLVNNWGSTGSAVRLALSGATCEGHLTMSHCLIDKCYAFNSGAGWNLTATNNPTTASTITMEDCVIQNCFTESDGSSDGGTFRTWSGPNCDVVMRRCQVLNNKSVKRSGGMMYNLARSQPMVLDHCTFDGNWGENGGGIQLQAAASLTACTITNNYAQVNGGGICNRPYDGGSGNATDYYPHNGSLILDENTTISDNEARGNGGGVYVYVSPTSYRVGYEDVWTVYYNNNHQQFAMNVELEGATISNNKATNGGGIFIYRDFDVYQTNAYLNWGIVENNTATGLGGACYIFSEIPTKNYHNERPEEGSIDVPSTFERNMVVAIGSSSSVHTLTMQGNVSANGGGVYATYDHNTSVTSSTIKASFNQNCIVGSQASPNIANSGSGGALYMDKGDLTVSGGTITYNTATSMGGGIYTTTNANVKVGAGDFEVQHNTVGGVPSNLYLPTNKKIEVISNAFDPTFLGIYTQSTATRIPVFEVTSVADTAYLSRIYRGMVNGTMNVVDDKQLYNAEYTARETILYFGNSSPWSPLQKTTTTSDLHLVNGIYEISNVKELTAFLWHVNGITTHGAFGSGDASAKGKLTADIDMHGHYWEPIGKSTAAYTGTFDGNGYIISNLTMVPSNESEERGLFGVVTTNGIVKNVNLRDSYLASGSGYIGGVVSQMTGGTLYNSVAQSQLLATTNSCTAGGLVGYINGGTVHSSIATCEMTGYTMGGLAGKISSSGNLYNSFANPLFHYSGGSYFVGGLVAENSGTVANCYVRFSRTQTLTGAKFGMLAGSNSGSISYCYGPDGSSAQFNHSYTYLYNNATTGLSNHDLYKKVDAPYLYNRPNDNLVGSTGKTLTEKLNNWVPANSDYAFWNRTTAGGWSYEYNSTTYTGGNINDDYPMPKMKGLSNVASTDGLSFDYAPSLGRAINKYNGLTGGGTVWLYASPKNAAGADEEVNVDNDSDVLLYIDEDATLLQADNNSLTAYTSQTLKTASNSRWHFISSSLSNSDIGFNYGQNATFNWDSNPCHVTVSENNDASLFPSDLPKVGGYSDMTRIDLYCFYEPEYHWLNLKRNTNSHWHLNATTVQIIYNGNGTGGNGNETHLVPGKGYLASIDKDQLLQNKGTLNNVNVTLYDVTKTDANAWAGLLGYNLLGNPYQSYLDFDAFISDAANSGLTASKGHTEQTYAVFDPEAGAYIQYKSGSSKGSRSADGMIHPHQGFMMRRTGNSSTAVFKNTMRSTNSTSPFRGEQPAFPLVNLKVTDNEGNADVAVLELGRNMEEGAEKLRANTSKSWLYLHYNAEDYGILFRSEVEDYQPLWFEASETGTYTLSWETANGVFDELKLIDNITGEVTDMLTHDSYVFEANPEQYKSRFKIVVGDFKDIEENEVPEPVEGPSFAYYANGEIHLVGADACDASLQIVNMLGQVIANINVARDVTTAGIAPGVYILRLTDNNGTRTQKIILE